MKLRHRLVQFAAVGGAAAVLAAAPLAASAQTVTRTSVGQRSTSGRSAASAGQVLGTITGTVDGFGGAPLAGVCVVAAGASGSGTALTDAAGRYLISGLRFGSYLVHYQDCRNSGRYLPAVYGAPGHARSVLIAGGFPVPLQMVTLEPAGPAARLRLVRAAEAASRAAAGRAKAPRGISGVVRNATGHGVANICVLATWNSANSGAFWIGQTGRGGRYQLPVGRGAWTVGFTAGCGRGANYAPQWWKYSGSPRGATKVDVRRGGGVAGIDAHLKPGATLTGTVHADSATGPALPGVCVQASGTGPMSGLQQQAVTGAGGAYRMTGLGTGTYQVTFDPGCGNSGSYVGSGYPGTVRVTDGATTSGIDGYLPPGATISGSVTAAATGAPAAGVCVMLANAQGAAGSAMTGPDGTYQISDLTAGRYTVMFVGGCGTAASYVPQYYRDSPIMAGATPVVLVAGQTASGIDVALQPGSTITGTVTNYSGQPLSGVCAVAQSIQAVGGLGDRGLISQFAGVFASGQGTASNGAYRIIGLAPGTYRVAFGGGCGHGSLAYAPRWFAPQGGARPAWITVGSGTTTSGVSAKLRRGATISGQVRNARGAGISGLCVDPASLSGSRAIALLVAGSMTGKGGRFVARGLAGGRYKVYFVPCLGGARYAARWYGGAGAEVSGRAIAITDGHVTKNINQVLTPGEWVAGQVTSAATGKPAAGMCVVAVDSSGNFVAGAIDYGNGRYRMGGLAPGRFRLETLACEARRQPLWGYYGPRVRVGARSAVSGVDIALPQGGAISGTVLAGSPAAAQPGICAEVVPVTGHGLADTAVTGLRGRYLLTGLAPGTYQVVFTPNCVL
ncbi:MAG: carboxypeptidase regulatory-like domain-containing protein, partial [Streptosporangiaceae bacterium]